MTTRRMRARMTEPAAQRADERGRPHDGAARHKLAYNTPALGGLTSRATSDWNQRSSIDARPATERCHTERSSMEVDSAPGVETPSQHPATGLR